VAAALLDAGLSRQTVDVMESWKAREVLDLLRSGGRDADLRRRVAPVTAAPVLPPEGRDPARDTI
jgi:hypothetical protein